MKAFNEIYHTAIAAAIDASAKIIAIYQQEVEITIKNDGSPVTQADLASSKIISSHLQSTGIPVMGEELKNKSFAERKGWESQWCVDPLDGTKMFILKNDEFAVNIAHVKDGIAIFGLIADPVKEKIIIGVKNGGVFTFSFSESTDQSKWKKILPCHQRNSPVVVACSRGFGSKSNGTKVFGYENELSEQYGELDYLKMGSALKFFELAEGRADIYIRLGPTMEWDIAAGQAIMEELGGTITSIEDGKTLVYNKESLFNPPFIAKTKAIL
ncbi:MAG: 3'(2'),5'-bisphosphate nucleotidase CysQ [Fluviicola sp.]|nr:3'(2'),5'-bisphosphate nucleotidase CysQ [Fluviicola sp.]